MISDYMENLKIDNPFSHLKPWQKTPYEKHHGRNIYKNSQGKYYIQRIKDKVRTRYGTYDTFTDAVIARDELIRNDWEVPEEIIIKEYYTNIHISHKLYYITFQGKYKGCTKTIEEALWYRDIIREHDWDYPLNPKDMDLKTGNPYIEDGLAYPVPERLTLPEEPPKKRGCIYSQGKQSHMVSFGDTYYGSYRTYEMAWYVREELNKCDFDKDKLEEIVDNYPVWYTKLMELYKYVSPRYNGYMVTIPPAKSCTGKLENIYFRRLEDALWERDLLLKYDFDEELLIECADDSLNPYYDMELPPYPQRKVRNLGERKDRTELLNNLFHLIQEDPNLSFEEYAKLCNTTSPGIRLVLKNEYETNWPEFKTLCESGENPNEVLEQKPKIYKPDLTRHYDNTNYVSYHKNEKTPYLIYHRDKETGVSVYFGAYPTRELANKISNDLQACNWDKSKLKEIQAKHGWESVVGSKRWVYPRKYTSRKTGETRIVDYQVRKKEIGHFGCYKDKRVAEAIRDLLVLCDWDKEKLDDIKCFVYSVIGLGGCFEGYHGYRLSGLSFL